MGAHFSHFITIHYSTFLSNGCITSFFQMIYKFINNLVVKWGLMRLFFNFHFVYNSILRLEHNFIATFSSLLKCTFIFRVYVSSRELLSQQKEICAIKSPICLSFCLCTRNQQDVVTFALFVSVFAHVLLSLHISS